MQNLVKNGPNPEQSVKNIQRIRATVAACAVLLDELQAAWITTVRAAQTPRSSLSDVTQQAAEVRATAEQVRKTLAELRAR